MTKYIKIYFLSLIVLILGQISYGEELIFDGNTRIKGLTFVEDPVDAKNKVAIWKNPEKGHRTTLFLGEKDLSNYEAISIRFYSSVADNSGIVMLCDSKDGYYFQKKFEADWSGWNSVILPLNEFTSNNKKAEWGSIIKIMLANNGYGGNRPSKEAIYYIDDVKLLKKSPTEKKTDVGESALLSTNSSSVTFTLDIDPSKEHIYGIKYELKGEPGASVKIHNYKTFTSNGDERQNIDIMGRTWLPLAYNDWEMQRLELLTKKGASKLVLKFVLSGKKPVEIRNLEVVKGGFPEAPPLPEAPYLEWIQSLKPNLSIATNSPLLLFEKGGVGLWDHSKGRSVYLDDTEEAELKSLVAPYRKLSPQQLIQLMPTKRPFWFKGGRMRDQYKWSPDNPDKIFDLKTGELFDYEKKYPIQGYETVTAPSGKKVTYAYHDSAKSDPVFKGARVYVDRFMTDVRMNAIFRAGYQMTMIYRKTGDIEYGVRAAAILWAFAKNIPDWPVSGQDSWNSPPEEKRLREYDYYSWFSFIMTGDWYVTHSGDIMWPIRYFDLIRDCSVWSDLTEICAEAKDAKEVIANNILHSIKMILIRDADYRYSQFVFFHNLSGTANRSVIQAGRALGIPELIHYGVNKVAGTFKNRFMSDGVFPESQWYSTDQIVRQSQALASLEDYKDPVGYTYSVDGTRLDVKDPMESIESYKRVIKALHRQSFPNGDAGTIHDSWSVTANYPKGTKAARYPARKVVEPYLYNAYGHGVLGRGTAPKRIEGHLHFGGFYNHGHRDMLNLGIWAYGDELVSDIGYSHITQYHGSSISHNLVLVNQSNQQQGKYNGCLLAWNARPDATQFVQADQGSSEVYPNCEIYRRALILLPFDNTENVVFDIFEVKGGKRHDWLARGCSDYKQNIETTLKVETVLDNLAADGIAVTNPLPWGNENKTRHIQDKYGEVSIFFGAIRNAKTTNITEPWLATFTPPEPLPATANAGDRAKSHEPKPSVKLHWLAPLDGTAIIAEAPANRYYLETLNRPAASIAWSKDLIPQILVKREGAENLESTFVAAWEPYMDKSFIKSITPLKELKGSGYGWSLQGNIEQKLLFYQAPEKRGILTYQDLSTNGRITVKSISKEVTAIDLYDGNILETSEFKAELILGKPLKIKDFVNNGHDYHIMVLGEIANANYEDEYICFKQQNNSSRWLKIAKIASKEGMSKIILQEDPGFDFNLKNNIMREKYFPFRIAQGEATLTLPRWINIKYGENISLRVSGETKLTIKNHPKAKVMIQDINNTWSEVATTFENDNLSFIIKPTVISNKWIELKIVK